ncbi:hypothetical protein NVP1178O_21 [Vibrio phage 1.178.O._10N.286.45.E12]|nr:hypothetical protein NVP1178O_21 [Vibrio phage 1.178.O._10N.286.45.E12]
MLITDKKDGWNEKVNFTDENDVFVGFDSSEQCCEVSGWYLSREININQPSEDGACGFEIDGYNFETSFFEEKLECGESGDENFAIFKLTKAEHEDLYLHLYNHHNGYYSHGFDATVGGEVWVAGSL